MKSSTIENYRSPRSVYNCTYFDAWGIATRCMKLGWHNLKHRFIPPTSLQVSLEPTNKNYIPPEGEQFDISMFKPEGFLHEELLNHFITFRLKGGTFSVNAAYLMHHFVLDERLGYQELARLLKYYKAKLSTPLQVDNEGTTNEGEGTANNNEGT